MSPQICSCILNTSSKYNFTINLGLQPFCIILTIGKINKNEILVHWYYHSVFFIDPFDGKNEKIMLRYRCLAINNNLTEAAEASLKINMLCEYRDN